eukprot:Hpha_TRINITY_DN16060_c0_g6::TRINITY_DN16060_c0_g6_i2::g.119438::m.119438
MTHSRTNLISLQTVELHRLLRAVRRVHVLESVEQRTLLASAVGHLGVNRPLTDGLLRDTVLDEVLAVVVLVAGRVQPVHTLSQTLEGGRGGVHTVVTHVGLRSQAQALPVLQDAATERVLRSLLGVGRPEHLTAEVRPGELGRLPLNGVPVDLLARGGERRAHGHEEPVEHVDLLLRAPPPTGGLDLAAVEAATELDHLAPSLRVGPQLVELRRVDTELLARVHRVEHLALGQGRVPVQAELVLELVLRDVQLGRLQDGRLRSDRVVVLVDELLLVDLLAREVTLTEDLDTLGLETLTHHRVGLAVDGVRLHEHERSVLRGGAEGRRGAAAATAEVVHTQGTKTRRTRTHQCTVRHYNCLVCSCFLTEYNKVQK